MQKSKVLTILCVCLLLCGCKKEESEVVISEPVQQDLRPICSEILWNDLNIIPISSVTAIESYDRELKIFPYNNSDSHITIEKINISNNNFWKTFSSSYKDTDNFKSTRKYSYVTLPNSITYGYCKIDDEYAYIVTSETLPSSYVEYVLEQICN